MILTVAVVSIAVITILTVLLKRHVQRGSMMAVISGLVLTGVAILAWGLTPAGQYALNIVEHIVLPVATLTVISFAGTMLLTRTSMLETISEDYVMVARAKGLPTNKIRDRYVSRNAILPVLTALILSLLTAVDGAVITETIFSYQGIGLTLVQAAQGQDVPLAIASFLFVGLFALVAHIVVDITYLFMDPRLRE